MLSRTRIAHEGLRLRGLVPGVRLRVGGGDRDERRGKDRASARRYVDMYSRAPTYEHWSAAEVSLEFSRGAIGA